jgi:hypothetical protein
LNEVESELRIQYRHLLIEEPTTPYDETIVGGLVEALGYLLPPYVFVEDGAVDIRDVLERAAWSAPWELWQIFADHYIFWAAIEDVARSLPSCVTPPPVGGTLVPEPV